MYDQGDEAYAQQQEYDAQAEYEANINAQWQAEAEARSAEEHEYDRRQEMADNARMEALEESLWEDWLPLLGDHE